MSIYISIYGVSLECRLSKVEICSDTVISSVYRLGCREGKLENRWQQSGKLGGGRGGEEVSPLCLRTKQNQIRKTWEKKELDKRKRDRKEVGFLQLSKGLSNVNHLLETSPEITVEIIFSEALMCCLNHSCHDMNKGMCPSLESLKP